MARINGPVASHTLTNEDIDKRTTGHDTEGHRVKGYMCTCSATNVNANTKACETGVGYGYWCGGSGFLPPFANHLCLCSKTTAVPTRSPIKVPSRTPAKEPKPRRLHPQFRPTCHTQNHPLKNRHDMRVSWTVVNLLVQVAASSKQGR